MGGATKCAAEGLNHAYRGVSDHPALCSTKAMHNLNAKLMHDASPLPHTGGSPYLP